MVSEMGYLLSFVYINAWVSQFFVGQPEGIMMAKSLAENIAAMSMLIGILLGVAIGSQIDGVGKKITPWYLGTFILRGLGLICMTTLVTDFDT